jgi:hypothetical protein
MDVSENNKIIMKPQANRNIFRTILVYINCRGMKIDEGTVQAGYNPPVQFNARLISG